MLIIIDLEKLVRDPRRPTSLRSGSTNSVNSIDEELSFMLFFLSFFLRTNMIFFQLAFGE